MCKFKQSVMNLLEHILSNLFKKMRKVYIYSSKVLDVTEMSKLVFKLQYNYTFAHNSKEVLAYLWIYSKTKLMVQFIYL